MTAGEPSDVYIVRFGTVQHGRTATVGSRIFWPVSARDRHRFRAPADVDATALEHQFASGIAWSRDEAGSIDRPE